MATGPILRLALIRNVLERGCGVSQQRTCCSQGGLASRLHISVNFCPMDPDLIFVKYKGLYRQYESHIAGIVNMRMKGLHLHVRRSGHQSTLYTRHRPRLSKVSLRG